MDQYIIFDPKKAKVVGEAIYQVVKKASDIAKTHLSPEQAQAKIRKYFTEKEVPVIFQETITTPR